MDLVVKDVKKCVKRIIEDVSNGEGKQVSQDLGNELVRLLSIALSSGLYNGLNLWHIFKLFERFPPNTTDSIKSVPNALRKRLKFAPKLVSTVVEMFKTMDDTGKAVVFLKCALNSGVISAVIELLSVTLTTNRTCILFPDEVELQIPDVWRVLLSNSSSEDVYEGEEPLLQSLLHPFYTEGSALRETVEHDSIDHSDVIIYRLLAAIAPIGGPSLDDYLLDFPRDNPQTLVVFNLELNATLSPPPPKTRVTDILEKSQEENSVDPALTESTGKKVKIIKKKVVVKKIRKVSKAPQTIENSEHLSDNTCDVTANSFLDTNLVSQSSVLNVNSKSDESDIPFVEEIDSASVKLAAAADPLLVQLQQCKELCDEFDFISGNFTDMLSSLHKNSERERVPLIEERALSTLCSTTFETSWENAVKSFSKRSESSCYKVSRAIRECLNGYTGN
eukprot:Tbor_TRINITY_DN5626_c0_g1::TRINITY_DN5626_c0_g1_i3::g.8138::m.8138